MDINLWRDYLNLPTKEKRKKLARKKVHADNIAKSQYRELVVRSSVMSQLSTTLREWPKMILTSKVRTQVIKMRNR